jgi:L-lactate dehydrogenase complex protein LldG
MTEELVQKFKEKAEAVSAEIYYVSDMNGAIEKALSLLKKEKKFKVTADDKIAELTAGQKAKGSKGALPGWSKEFKLVFPKKAEEFSKLQAALVEADFGVAETGTLVHLDSDFKDRWRWTLPEVCAVFLDKGKIVGTTEELLEAFNSYLNSRDSEAQKGLPKQISFITGPSRTADIEGQVELGVHGPLRLLIFVYG